MLSFPRDFQLQVCHLFVTLLPQCSGAAVSWLGRSPAAGSSCPSSSLCLPAGLHTLAPLPLISGEVVLLLKSCIFLVCILLEFLGSMGPPIRLLIIWGLQLISVKAVREGWSSPRLPEALYEPRSASGDR